MKMDGRTGQVVAAIRERISSRALLSGERLPSVRRLAAMQNVSPSTVVNAYDYLVSEGAITSRRGSGFFVAETSKPVALSEIGPKLDREIDPFWVSRQSLEAGETMLRPGCGWLPEDWMPVDTLRRNLRQISRSGDALLTEYGNPYGHPCLRQFLARRFFEEGLAVRPEQVLLTPSGTQAIDLVCRLLLRPGDTVIVDDPCYFNFRALLKAHQVNLVGVTYGPDGPDIDMFARMLHEHRPRLYVTNSALHNPTGASLSPQIAHKLLGLAEAHDLTIVEDDIFAEFEPVLSTRLALLDGLERVIRIGSFSKTLSASTRCGYIAARPEWTEALVDLQIAVNFGGPSAAVAELIHSVLKDASYRKHVSALRERLAHARRDVAGRLSRLGVTPRLMPQGGLFLWCQLPEGVDSALLARAALNDGVVLAPGNVFSVSQSCGGFMRFNVSQMVGDLAFDALKRHLSGTDH